MSSSHEHEPKPHQSEPIRMVYPNEANGNTKYEILPLPEVIDEAWCDMVTEVYKQSTQKVTIISDTCLRQVMNPSHPEAKISYQLVTVNPVDNKSPGIEGTIAGMKMWTVWNERLEREDKPHVVVRNAKLEGQDVAISQTPEQEVLIPLGDGLRQLLLHS